MARRRGPPADGAMDVEVKDGILDLFRSKVAPYDLSAAIERARERLRAEHKKVTTAFCTSYPVDDTHLAVFGTLVEMTVFGLMSTKVTGVGLPELAVLPKLQVLDLTCSPLSGEGMDSLPRFRVLEKFRASGTGVPMEALKPLVQTQVQFVELDDLPVTEDDLGSWVLQIPNLNDLSISGKLLTRNVMSLLRRVPRKLHVRINSADHLQDEIPLEDRISDQLHVILL